jgi:hypothetical protein
MTHQEQNRSSFIKALPAIIIAIHAAIFIAGNALIRMSRRWRLRPSNCYLTNFTSGPAAFKKA